MAAEKRRKEMKGKWIVLFFAVLALVFAFTSTPLTTAQQETLAEKLQRLYPGIPLPENLKVIQPSNNAKLTRLANAWIGVWDGVLDHILVVERIDSDSLTATVVYAHGAAPQWNIRQGRWVRLQAKFEGEELVLELPNRARATVRYQLKREYLWGWYSAGRITSQTMMQRIPFP